MFKEKFLAQTQSNLFQLEKRETSIFTKLDCLSTAARQVVVSPRDPRR